jgi:hypothetical protein
MAFRREKRKSNPSQRYLKFPLTLPLSPAGRGRGSFLEKVRDKFSDFNV